MYIHAYFTSMSNILITGPSLNENVNISGISSLTKVIIANNSVKHHYFHFVLGRKDGDTKGFKWLFNQLFLLPRFALFTRKHRIDLIHINTDLTPASVLRDFLLVSVNLFFLRKKSLLHIHGGYLLMEPPEKKSLLYFMIRFMLRNQSSNIVLSEVEKEKIKKNYNIDSLVMPNAVSISHHALTKDFSGKLTFFFMGRIVKSKGIFLLTKCLSELSAYYNQFDFQIYGTGPDLKDFIHELSEMKGLNYHYHGVVKGNEKEKVFNKSHIFLLPSLFGEGLPIAMLECMNNGCVPVVSDDASIGTVVKNGSNGYLIPKGSLFDLKECLIHVLNNREELYQISNKAKLTISSSYNLDNYLTELNNTYKLLGNESNKLFRDRLKPDHV